MPSTDKPQAPHRLTLADQLARQHELLMAQATKPARMGLQSIEYGERATGDKNGHLYFKSVQVVQTEDETDVQFLGRQETYVREAIRIRDLLNADVDKQAVGAKPKAGE